MIQTDARDQASISPWQRINRVFEDAKTLKALYNLKREDPDSTPESAMAWARERFAEAKR